MVQRRSRRGHHRIILSAFKTWVCLTHQRQQVTHPFFPVGAKVKVRAQQLKEVFELHQYLLVLALSQIVSQFVSSGSVTSLAVAAS